MKRNTIFLLVALPPVIWLTSLILLYTCLPDWETRGLFGDMFGAANAFFSSLTLIGVFITIFFQRKEFKSTFSAMSAQLSEMERSRVLSSQPLPFLQFKDGHIENPRLFYSPPDDKHEIASRYNIVFEILNKSNFSAVDINVDSSLRFRNKNSYELKSTGRHISVLSPMEKYEKQVSFMYIHDYEKLFFESLRSGSLPELEINIYYKNIIGGYFCITQNFLIDIDDAKDDNILKKWHSLLTSYNIDYKKEIQQLIKNRKDNNIEKWEKAYQKLKIKITNITKNESLNFKIFEIPGSFKIKILEEEIYLKTISNLFYGRAIPTLRESCLSKNE